MNAFLRFNDDQVTRKSVINSFNAFTPKRQKMKQRLAIFLHIIIVGLLFVCSNAFGAIPGDVDGSGSTDLKDVIIALQVCSGFTPDVDTDADVNGDGRIGLEEAVYALKAAALTNTGALTYSIVDTGQTDLL